MEQLPPQVQEQLSQLQQLQKQVQTLARQKQQLEINSNEVERALEELSEMSEDAKIYKSVGGIMVNTDHPDAKGELEDRKETLNLRLQQVERQEERAKKRLQKLRAKIQDALGAQPPATGAG